MVGPEFLSRFPEWLPSLAAPSTEEGRALLRMIGSMPMRRFVADMRARIPAGELERLATVAAEARAARSR